ncbi:MAG TPA: hypothetical protein PLJ47_17480 [Candidatus Hydrogenedentes bacterium]|nr:hypothetical protein [Candidatus Hydrogenedentota bacterium]HRK36393.1 hypothetical protein [Candidatus Hydrogenedentota bacterium]
MSEQQEKLWTASIDGELSASEANEFDQSLTPAQKTNLAAEMTVERVVSERLARGGACPDDVWQRTMAAVAERTTQPAAPRRARAWAYGLGALAAMITLTAAGFALRMNIAKPETPDLLMIAKGTTVEDFVLKGQLHGATASDVNAFLQQHGIALELTSTNVKVPGDHHTPREFLGVNPVEHHGEKVMELLFNCCDRPVKVVVAKAGSQTALEMGAAMAEGKLQMSKRVGDYVASIVGRHEVVGLLDYITEPEAV